MNDFKSIYEYQAYAERLQLSELRDIARGIDKYKYKDRYDLIIYLIKEKEAENIVEDNASIRKYYPPGVKVICNTYIFLVVLAIIVLPIAILIKHKYASNINIVTVLAYMIVHIIIIYGILFRKTWVVLLVLFYSYMTLFGNLLNMLSKKDVGVSIGDLCFNFAYIVFLIYSIFVFSKKDAKKYYNYQDNVVI